MFTLEQMVTRQLNYMFQMNETEENTSELILTQYWNNENETNFQLENQSSTGNNTIRSTAGSQLYIYLTSILLTFILIAVICNTVILISALWIRRPISPTLQLSLSMTTADSYTLLISAIAIIINSLVPKGLQIKEGEISLSQCQKLIIECLRYGGLVTTFFHIFALAGNHYHGVKYPLQHAKTMNNRTISILVFILWSVPPILFVFVFYYFVDDDQGFRTLECNAR